MECDSYQSGPPDPPCTFPSGKIDYASASGDTAESYDLTVPDWVGGPAGPAAIEFPDRATPSGSAADGPEDLRVLGAAGPGAAVSSVTLPDVGRRWRPIRSPHLPGDTFPALHILGIAVANTTTATPGSAALASGQTWTGAWASPTEGAYAPPSGDGTAFTNETFRIAMQASTGGSAVRLRLSDDLGWLPGPAPGRWTSGDVTVAPEGTGAALTGRRCRPPSTAAVSVTIPEGGDAYSNPVDHDRHARRGPDGIDLPVQQRAVPGTALAVLRLHGVRVGRRHQGDQTANTSGSPFSGTGTTRGPVQRHRDRPGR